MWREAGEAGLLCLSIPEAYGGAGGDFRHEVVLMEQIVRKDVSGFAVSLHNAIVAPYILHYGSEEQKTKWLPKKASGEFIGAIAKSEPGAGSDLQGIKTSARLEGNHYVINGQNPEKARILGGLTPLIDLALQPRPSDKTVDQRANVSLLADRGEKAIKLLDFAGEALNVGAREKGEYFTDFVFIPILPLPPALRLAFRPIAHIQPLNVADGNGGLDLRITFDQDRRDRAALLVQCDADLVETHAGIADRVARQKGQHPIRLSQSIDDAATPILAGLNFEFVDPDFVPGRLQIRPMRSTSGALRSPQTALIRALFAAAQFPEATTQAGATRSLRVLRAAR